ncbi:MAG: acyl--CoA ligase [Acidimicrobiales bacterium]|jgi:acyl-CoA synthetase|nr:acyl--CoA ligase [Acidimicrobiales bacterium]
MPSLDRPRLGDVPRAAPAVVAEHRASGWWGDATLGDALAANAVGRPHDRAFVTVDRSVSWGELERSVTVLAEVLAGLGLDRGDRVAVVLPDTDLVHVALHALPRAGLVAMGIGTRAGDAEVAHLAARSGARALVTTAALRGRPADDLVDAVAALGHRVEHLVVIPDEPCVVGDQVLVDGRPGPVGVLDPGLELGPDELFLLNSTSGTTGLPKCVMHTQNRWIAYHRLAVRAGGFGDDEVFMSLLPAPFGFGLWTSHFTPTLLASPTVVMERFDADLALDLVERERVTVLCCVSTQFIMLLNAQAERPRDLSSLRSMFTGGEAVPFERAAEFERETGAAVLQFYGSNETGALSGTTVADDRDVRLRTAGRIIDEMHVRLFDPDDGSDITGSGRPGRPGCRGPVTCLGYWADDEANAALFTDDGWMLMGDIVEIDPEGVLTVVGRTSDFVIRGGKNISAPAVEAEIGTHPAVAMVAVVAWPDPVFGERVCAYVEVRPGHAVELDGITDHLRRRGVSREWWPERLVVVDELPRSSGGKVAKGELRVDAERRAAAEAVSP